MRQRRVPDTVTFVRGDITEQRVDAIVNAANSGLLGGGGVDGAIHAHGGPMILAECRALRAGPLKDGLPAGQAVSTTAGMLPARRVIHTVGPIWRGGSHGERELLASAYTQCLMVARSENLRSIAFPSISTGAYGYPTEQAALVALKAVRDFEQVGGGFEEIRFVLFSRTDYDIYTAACSDVDATPA